MLTAILERNSWLIAKLGMPLVYFYHLIISSVFFNTAAEDATGLEKIANQALIPFHYFFEGKTAIPMVDENGTLYYKLKHSYDYEDHFFTKTAVSCTLLPFSVVVGGTLKSLSYLSSETRDRAMRMALARHETRLSLNTEYYKKIGLEVEDFREAPFIDPPQWKKRPESIDKLKDDCDALKEIIRILSKHQIPFWLDCGSCLGTYQYGSSIPNDWDIDMAILLPDFENVKNALEELDPEKYIALDWSGRDFPNSYLKVYIRESGGMIDIYNFVVDEEKKEVHTLFSHENNIFFPKSWKIREKRYTTPMPFDYVFPLKRAIFNGIEVPVPGNTKKYLQVFYGENLAPARIYNEVTGNYEKDLTHPYWQLPCAH